MPLKEVVIPTIQEAKTCSVTVNAKPYKRKKDSTIYNASCTIHAHTIPSESVAIVLTVKDAASRDDALIRISEAAEYFIDNIGWELMRVQVNAPE